MGRGHALSIEPITADDVSPPEMARLAAQNGVAYFGVVVQQRPGRPDWGLIGDTPMRRQTLEACRQCGVQVDLIESFLLEPSQDIAAFAPALESGAWLGARALTLLVRDPDRPRLIDRIHLMCELAEPLGLQVLMEFTPRMSIKTFADAAELAAQVARPSLGIVVDSLHMARTGAWTQTIPLLRSPLVRRLQLSDGPLVIAQEDGLHEAMSERQLPGEGQFALGELIAAVPDGIRIGIEVPQERAVRAGLSAAQRVKRAVDATRRLVIQA